MRNWRVGVAVLTECAERVRVGAGVGAAVVGGDESVRAASASKGARATGRDRKRRAIRNERYRQSSGVG